MYIRCFKDEHRVCIKQWLWYRDEESNIASWLGILPRIGLVVYHLNQPVAIGFLRQVEGGLLMMDSFITNPSQPPEIRDKAMNKLGYRMIATAKRLKSTGIIAFSSCDNTLKRAKRNGFVRLPLEPIILNLQE